MEMQPMFLFLFPHSFLSAEHLLLLQALEKGGGGSRYLCYSFCNIILMVKIR